MSITIKPKVVAIVGSTASGKTALSIALAHRFNGEIISADSRQVYQGMDLGTGKVTVAEMEGVPHHLLDIADPKVDTYTAAQFEHDATKAIADITQRGNLPIIAGGTFFYLDILRGRQSSAPVPPNETLRTTLEQKSTEELSTTLTSLDPRRAATIDHDNRRRLIRALEVVSALGAVPETPEIDSPYDMLVLGIDIPKDVVNERIYERIITRINHGMIEEIDSLHSSGVSWERMASFGLEYRIIGLYLQNILSKDEMIEELTAKTRQFAKRQRVWLKRDTTITWLPFPVDTEEAAQHVKQFLTSD